MKQFVGVDIGGSHISSLLIGEGAQEYEIHGRLFTDKVSGGAARDEILSAWCRHLYRTIDNATNFSGKVAFAMPGPFDYEEGIAGFLKGSKFASLGGQDIRQALFASYNCNSPILAAKAGVKGNRNEVEELRFTNDAASFGLGVSTKSDPKRERRTLAITLGTGVGSAFVDCGRLVTSGPDIPPGGEIYDQPFHEGKADDYFSTRWFVHWAEVERGLIVPGVKELLEIADQKTITNIFADFNANLRELLEPLLSSFHPDDLFIGGNIARAWPHFAPELSAWVTPQGIRLHQALDGERLACLGAVMNCYPLTV